MKIDSYGLDDGWAEARAAVERRLPGVPLIEGAKALTPGNLTVELRVQPITRERAGPLLRIASDRGRTAAHVRPGVAGSGGVGRVRLGEGRGVPSRAAAGREAHPEGGSEERAEARASHITVPAVQAGAADPRYAVAVLPVAAVRRRGPEDRAPRSVHRLGRAPDHRTAGGDAEVGSRGGGPRGPTSTSLSSEGSRTTVTIPLWLLLGAALVLVLGGTLVATGLAAADMRPDLTTMAAVGAPPGTRRLVVAGQAGFIAGLGVLIGAVAGSVTGIAATWPTTLRGHSDILTPAGALPSSPPTAGDANGRDPLASPRGGGDRPAGAGGPGGGDVRPDEGDADPQDRLNAPPGSRPGSLAASRAAPSVGAVSR